MNSNPENDLGFTGGQFEDFSGTAVLDELQEKLDDDDSTKYVLIKHDYYSSDSVHGRELLGSFLQNLCESSYKNIIVYLLDKGTLLLDESNPLYDEMLRLVDRAEMIIADKESISADCLPDTVNGKIILRTTFSITEEIIYLTNLLILE